MGEVVDFSAARGWLRGPIQAEAKQSYSDFFVNDLVERMVRAMATRNEEQVNLLRGEYNALSPPEQADVDAELLRISERRREI